MVGRFLNSWVVMIIVAAIMLYLRNLNGANINLADQPAIVDALLRKKTPTKINLKIRSD